MITKAKARGKAKAAIPLYDAARKRRLRKVLKAGLGLSPAELKASILPGYYETYRVMEAPARYGKRRSRR